GDFGANAWLVDDMWKKFQVDKSSVDQSWWPVLERYGAALAAAPGGGTTSEPVTASIPVTSPITTPAQPARTTNAAPRVAPIPADAPRAKDTVRAAMSAKEAAGVEPQDAVTPLRGMARTLSKNMDQSIQVPTATSVR